MKCGQKTKNGFTIVELLIVVVVIAILATITIVSYSGIQDKAKLSVARTDTQALTQQVGLFTALNSRPPLPTDQASPAPDFEQILKGANLFEATRRTNAQIDAGVHDKLFLFCGPINGSSLTIVNMHALLGNLPGTLQSHVGKVLYYYKDGAFLETVYQYDAAINELGGNVCKSINPTFVVGGTWYRRWSFDLPNVH